MTLVLLGTDISIARAAIVQILCCSLSLTCAEFAANKKMSVLEWLPEEEGMQQEDLALILFWQSCDDL